MKKTKIIINDHLKLCHLSNYELLEILESVREGVYVTGHDTRLIYMNRTSEELYGFSLEEMYGKKNAEINVKFNRWYPSALMNVYKEKRTYTIEQKATHSGKKILTTLCPVLDENRDVKMVVCLSRVKSYSVDIDYSDKFSKLDIPDEFEGNIITNSPQMHALLANAKRIAKLDTTVLLTGKTGTGKNMVAKYIHNKSDRKNKPFVMVNCSAIPENLIESEFFGYEPYTFSGSNPKGKTGLIAAAEGGTLFLDEIGEMPLELQPKILGFMQNKTYMQVGGRKEIHGNVRIITATNRNLYLESQKGRFREDLYWRLSVIEIYIPELKDRKGDIRLLSKMFFDISCQKFHFQKTLAEETYGILCNYNWPGNVRQLKNFMEKLAITVESNVIYPKDVAFIEAKNVAKKSQVRFKENYSTEMISLEEQKERLEKEIVMEAYARYKTCRMVAKKLQISTTKAHKLIHKYCNVDK